MAEVAKMSALDNTNIFSDDDNDGIRTGDEADEGARKVAEEANEFGEGGSAGMGEGEQGIEELKMGDDNGKGKKRLQKRKFTEELLMSADGLKRIYREFPLSWKSRGRGNEAQDLTRLITLYKEWAYQLHAGISFPDVVKYAHKFGSRRVVKDACLDMREEERSRYMEEVLGYKGPQPSSPQGMTSPEAMSAEGDPESSTKSANTDADFDVDDMMMQMLDAETSDNSEDMVSKSSDVQHVNTGDDANVKEKDNIISATKEVATRKKVSKRVIEDSDSEDELVFDDAPVSMNSTLVKTIEDDGDEGIDEGTQEQGEASLSLPLEPTQIDAAQLPSE